MKFFHNSIFHRLERDLIVEGGRNYESGKPSTIWKELEDAELAHEMKGFSTKVDPRVNDYSKYFPDQLSAKIKHKKIGIVGCSNTLSDENDSTFYITLASDLKSLDLKHTIFGEVTEGLEELMRRINPMLVDPKTKAPVIPVRILKVTVLYDPFPDPIGFEELHLEPPYSPTPIVDASVAHINTIDDELRVLDDLQAKEAKGRAVTLEILGDIPDADLKPPDNVLFVCKLNPETQEEDLELIFSRFGEIISCEIVKDYKTGESLQYGFIEFERTEECEDAFFKMQDVLIDDRRIHVNFCQSIAKKGFDKIGNGEPGGKNFALTNSLKKKYIMPSERIEEEEDRVPSERSRRRIHVEERHHRKEKVDEDKVFYRSQRQSHKYYDRSRDRR